MRETQPQADIGGDTIGQELILSQFRRGYTTEESASLPALFDQDVDTSSLGAVQGVVVDESDRAGRIFDWDSDENKVFPDYDADGIIEGQETVKYSKDEISRAYDEINDIYALNAEMDSASIMTRKFIRARDEYARMNAIRGSRAIWLKYSKDAILAAEDKLEVAHQNLLEQEAKVQALSGVSGEELKRFETATAAESEYSIINALYEQRMVASGRARFDHGNFEEIQPKTAIGRGLNKFYKFLNNLDDKKYGKAAKVAITAATGLGIGAVATASGGVLLAPIAAGIAGLGGTTVASRQSKAYLFSRTSKKSKNLFRADDQHEDLQEKMKDENHNITDTFIGTLVQTENGVIANRSRMKKATGGLVLGALAGSIAQGLIQHDIFGLRHHSTSQIISNNTKKSKPYEM